LLSYVDSDKLKNRKLAKRGNIVGYLSPRRKYCKIKPILYLLKLIFQNSIKFIFSLAQHCAILKKGQNSLQLLKIWIIRYDLRCYKY